MNKNSKIYISGHNGMLGSAIVRLLKKEGYSNLILKSKSELDLRSYIEVESFFKQETPDIVVLAAAKVGGINANMVHPAEFLYDNLTIQNNVIQAAYLNNVKKFCFLGSSCIYPRECLQPIKEEYLLTGPLEPTNEGYALAKVAGLKMIEYYNKQYNFPGISLMPCNLYGTNDSFDLGKSHVLSALVRKFVDSFDNKEKTVTVWGTGIAQREFMHVDDAAEAVLYFLINNDSPDHVNIGWGEDVSIKELSELIKNETGFQGDIIWDTEKPDGMLKKCMDVTRMKAFGYMPKITLREGVAQTIKEYKKLKAKGAIS